MIIVKVKKSELKEVLLKVLYDWNVKNFDIDCNVNFYFSEFMGRSIIIIELSKCKDFIKVTYRIEVLNVSRICQYFVKKLDSMISLLEKKKIKTKLKISDYL